MTQTTKRYTFVPVHNAVSMVCLRPWDKYIITGTGRLLNEQQTLLGRFVLEPDLPEPPSIEEQLSGMRECPDCGVLFDESYCPRCEEMG